MNYNDEISEIKSLINNKDYSSAENRLLKLLSTAKDTKIEDEENTHYSIGNYIELLLFFNMYNPKKKNIVPEYNMSQIYYYLGFINIEMKNFGKAIEYYENGLKWNPVDVVIMFEKAAAYRMLGEIERFKAEIEKTYIFIYDSGYMAKYYRELGWYYSEKRIFDVANALYTHSISYLNTELAINELKYIAQQQNTTATYSTKDDIKKLFTNYNIPFNFNKTTTGIIFDEYQRLTKENPNAQVINVLSMALYDITLDKRFMLYATLKDEEHGIELKIPETWKTLNRSAYSKFGISDNTVFLFLTPQNQNVSIVCDGKCTSEQLEDAYKLNIENMKKQGTTIVKEYTIKGQKNINQLFVDVKENEKVNRIFQNYLIVNGYLFNITWQVPTDVEPDKLLESVNNSFAMNVIWSLRKINENTNIQDVATEVVEKANNLVEQRRSLKQYTVKAKGYPIFKFYFPENLGEYSPSKFTNIFELKKDGIQKIRVMVSKCDSEDNLKIDAKKWIEKNKIDAKMEDVSYREDKINNIPIEVYELKYTNRDDLAHKIYKIGYVNHCRITISGGIPNGKEKIIDDAFKTLEYENITEEASTNTDTIKGTNFFKQMDNDLKTAFENYKSGLINETLNILDKLLDNLLKEDKTLKQDPFWKDLSCSVFKAIVLDNFYHGKDLQNNDLDSLLANKEQVKNNISDFCNIFKENNEIKFIFQIENISEKMLGDVLHIIMVNIGEKNITIKTNIVLNTQKTISENQESQPIIINCPACNKEFTLNWNVPANEKTFYCKCPNCGMELKRGNPNYKG